MRVLIITHENKINGASRSMLGLIDNLKDRVDFFVVVPVEEGEITAELRKRSVPYIYIHSMRWSMIKPNGDLKGFLKWSYLRLKYCLAGQFLNYLNAKKLKKIIVEKKIDIIHTNVSVMNIGALLHKLTGIPHIWYIREFGQEDFYMNPLCSEKRFYNTIDKYSTTVVTVSKALADKYGHLLKHKLPRVIYNGIESNNQISMADKLLYKRDKVNFLITGTLCTGKGQRIAIRAVHYLLDFGESDFHLYIAGRGDSTQFKYMPEFDYNYISFLGQVEDMPSIRKDMDVELVCSYCEAFGRVTAEAMMACMPVIGSNSGGTPELIEDGVTGFLFEKGNAEELAEKMKYFIHNREKILDMGQKAQEYALEHFTIERCANEVYDEYYAVLRREGGVLHEIVFIISCGGLYDIQISEVLHVEPSLSDDIVIYDFAPSAYIFREGGMCA